jgi:hypothetical protein
MSRTIRSPLPRASFSNSARSVLVPPTFTREDDHFWVPL